MKYTDIKLKKIDPNQLCSALNCMNAWTNQALESQVIDIKLTIFHLSLLEQINKKLWKKYIDKREVKNFTITLKYYEAYEMYQVLMKVELDYDAQQLLNQLDQKLA